MRRSAGGPVSGRQFSEFQGRARAFAGPISIVIRQFSVWQGTDRFDSGRRPVDTIYVLWWPAGCAHGRGGTTNRGCRPMLESSIPSSDAFNAERPRDEELASAGILSAPRENTEES